MQSVRFFLGLASLFWASTGMAGAPVGDFALLDHQGKFHQLSYYGDQRAVVVFVHKNESEAVAAQLTDLEALKANTGDAEVVFFGLNAADARDDIVAAANAAGTDLPILVDETQLVAESLGVEHYGEALLIDPANMQLVYQGPVSAAGTQALAEALHSLLSGAPLAEVADTTAATERVAYTSRTVDGHGPISYSKDIVPILEANCVSCHNEGGIGPWAMTNHAMVRGWAPMMREVVMTRRMPPGQIDTHVSKPITNAAGLTVAERQKLVHWIDAGAPVDGETDPLTELKPENPRFTLGEPDMIVKVPPQAIPATGIIDYRYIPVPLNLDRDVWVRGMEFVPGDREVLHHVIAYLSSPADKNVRGRETGAARGESVGGFAPGRTGRFIPRQQRPPSSPRARACCCRCTTPRPVARPSTRPRWASSCTTSRRST